MCYRPDILFASYSGQEFLDIQVRVSYTALHRKQDVIKFRWQFGVE